MAKQYAGALGSLGVAIVMARGAMVGAEFGSTVTTAVVALLALSAVGMVVGSIAEATVDHAVRERLQTQLNLLSEEEA